MHICNALVYAFLIIQLVCVYLSFLLIIYKGIKDESYVCEKYASNSSPPTGFSCSVSYTLQLFNKWIYRSVY